MTDKLTASEREVLRVASVYRGVIHLMGVQASRAVKSLKKEQK